MTKVLLKAVLPSSALQRGVVVRSIIWRISILLVRLGDAPVPRRTVLRGAHFGWGNEGYSATVPLLREILRRANECDGDVIEAGSGLSTVLLSYCLPEHRRLLAFENDAEWTDFVNGQCGPRRSLPVVHSPLIDHQTYVWYQLPLELEDMQVGLFVCDGPPGRSKGGRYGGLPQLHRWLSPGAVVILDDVERDSETDVIDRWKVEFGLDALRFESAGREYAVGQLPIIDHADASTSGCQ